MRSSVRTLIAGLAVVTALAPDAASAQQNDKLSIHGYLTQGYAVSDSALTMGIPKEGTTDYRRAAILLRYASTDKDNFVLQLAHRRLGNSPSMAFESDVKLDWAFYEHEFGTQTRMRVGKAPIPFGIYNETRYVGTQIPLYRLTVMQPLFSESPFAMEASAYAGSFSYLDFATVQVTPGNFQYLGQRVRAQSALGGQLWISTPLEGLRFGGGGQRYTVDKAFFQPRKTTFDGYFASVDGKFERFMLRSEFRHVDAKKIMKYNAWYTQGGVQLTSRLSINAQSERASYQVKTTTSNYKVQNSFDDAVGISWAVSPNLVFKVEGHQRKDHNVEGVSNVLGTPAEGNYYISSLSVAF
jgi:hypothetical protein